MPYADVGYGAHQVNPWTGRHRPCCQGGLDVYVIGQRVVAGVDGKSTRLFYAINAGGKMGEEGNRARIF